MGKRYSLAVLEAGLNRNRWRYWVEQERIGANARDTMLFNNESRVVSDPDRVARLAMERALKLS